MNLIDRLAAQCRRHNSAMKVHDDRGERTPRTGWLVRVHCELLPLPDDPIWRIRVAAFIDQHPGCVFVASTGGDHHPHNTLISALLHAEEPEEAARLAREHDHGNVWNCAEQEAGMLVFGDETGIDAIISAVLGQLAETLGAAPATYADNHPVSGPSIALYERPEAK